MDDPIRGYFVSAFITRRLCVSPIAPLLRDPCSAPHELLHDAGGHGQRAFGVSL